MNVPSNLLFREIQTLKYHFSELDLGEDWPESEDESEDLCGSESLPADIVNKAERKNSQTVRIVPDQRKSSTGSNVMIPLSVC